MNGLKKVFNVFGIILGFFLFHLFDYLRDKVDDDE